ncbi:NUDIX domain-containing protein [Arenibacter sp. GZD96]|uniref:NUDIX hydrolase n=1 Tax=Aurantibrevibacter litoralis TaxID=3106030 RepID=UPI002AFDECBD|nr:NUDIX domain-containing protein [Arenibacter sp. GZD-96]MEA1786876.1 NUDIX domain-containing protein [Arenibacter sp. GZD-96]
MKLTIPEASHRGILLLRSARISPVSFWPLSQKSKFCILPHQELQKGSSDRSKGAVNRKPRLKGRGIFRLNPFLKPFWHIAFLGVNIMDEFVDILDAAGNDTGATAKKSEAHRKGLFHPTVHVWFYTFSGEILVQKRAKTKDTFPSLWDVSVAGHIAAGESAPKAALREVKEEIGLTILETDLKKIGYFKSVHRHSTALYDCEYQHTFICPLQVPIDTLFLQKSEVDDLKLISISTFNSELKDAYLRKQYVPHDWVYYKTIIQAITQVL